MAANLISFDQESILMQIILIILIFFSTMEVHAHSLDLYHFDNQKDANRFYSLIKEIRCVVCQNQTIADSSAPIAKDLCHRISALIKEKKSNAEIKNFLVTRYGEHILLNPRFSVRTSLLWLFPFFSVILVVFYGFIFQQRKGKVRRENKQIMLG